jgi:hypothetical protein
MQEKYTIAETFFDRVTNQDSENVIAWYFYALYYELTNQDLNAEITIKKAHKLNYNVEYQQEQHQLAQMAASETETDDQLKKDEDGANLEDAQGNKLSVDNSVKSRQSKRGPSQISKVKEPINPKGIKSPGTASVIGAPSVNIGPKSPLPASIVGGSKDTDPSAEATHLPKKSIYMKAAEFLIEYNAFSVSLFSL